MYKLKDGPLFDDINSSHLFLLWYCHYFTEALEGFAGLSVSVCGDLYQLPPVNGTSIFNSKLSVKGLLTQDLWRTFRMAELNKTMRQREDLQFIQILNKSVKEIVMRKLKPF